LGISSRQYPEALCLPSPVEGRERSKINLLTSLMEPGAERKGGVSEVIIKSLKNTCKADVWDVPEVRYGKINLVQGIRLRPEG
jgi:hypothetical protein